MKRYSQSVAVNGIQIQVKFTAMNISHPVTVAVLVGCYLMLAPLLSRSALLNADSRAEDLQGETALDSRLTCEDARSKMASESKALGPEAPTNIKSTPRTHADLHWSMFAAYVAPNGAWQVEVHPVITSGGNQTPVILRECRKAGSWPLFILERDADMHWGPDSSSLLVDNEPVAAGNQLLFFDVRASSEGKHALAPDTLDKEVMQVLLQRLGKEKRVEFYTPTFLSWKDNKLLLAVGGSTSSAGVVQMTGYCYGFMIDTKTLRVQDVLSTEELKAVSGAECP
jgi:hypothetical protein